jgi:hypothetical protein
MANISIEDLLGPGAFGQTPDPWDVGLAEQTERAMAGDPFPQEPGAGPWQGAPTAAPPTATQPQGRSKGDIAALILAALGDSYAARAGRPAYASATLRQGRERERTQAEERGERETERQLELGERRRREGREDTRYQEERTDRQQERGERRTERQEDLSRAEKTKTDAYTAATSERDEDILAGLSAYKLDTDQYDLGSTRGRAQARGAIMRAEAQAKQKARPERKATAGEIKRTLAREDDLLETLGGMEDQVAAHGLDSFGVAPTEIRTAFYRKVRRLLADDPDRMERVIEDFEETIGAEIDRVLGETKKAAEVDYQRRLAERAVGPSADAFPSNYNPEGQASGLEQLLMGLGSPGMSRLQ